MAKAKTKTKVRDLKPRRSDDEDDMPSIVNEREEAEHTVVRKKKKKGKKSKGDYDFPESNDSADDDDGDGEETSKQISQRHKLSNRIPKRSLIDFTKFDKRKFKGNAKKKLEAWKGNRSRLVDAWTKSQAAGARKKLGHSAVFVGSEADALLVGIPMYSGYGKKALRYPGCLPVEFVIANDVFPLAVVIQLVAKTGVGKSGLVAEFGRWFAMANGVNHLNENESKFNARWYKSIMREYFDEMLINRCKDVEDWQDGVSTGLRDTKNFMAGSAQEPGPGRTFPFMSAVDSIMGKMSRKSQEKILGVRALDGSRGTTGEGHAGRGHPEEALSITRYLKSIAGEFDNFPFALVLVNHLKLNKDDMGNEERSKTGGKTVDFQESFELELAKVGGMKKKIECKDWEGYQVRLSCEKNSFGPGNRSVITRILWWEEEFADGSWQQRTIWDWDWSTVWLLNNIMRGDKASPRLRQNLKDAEIHLECPVAGDVDNLAWSKNLGMKAKDAVPWSELGAMIRQETELLDRLRKALRINRRPLFQGDYLDQIEGLVKDLP